LGIPRLWNRDSGQFDGVYGVSVANNGSVSYLSISNLSNWSAVYNGQIAGGNSCYTTWVMTGTLPDVVNDMLQLHQQQMSGSIPHKETTSPSSPSFCNSPTSSGTFPLDRYYSSYWGAHWVTTGNTNGDYYVEFNLGYLLRTPQPGTTAVYGCIANNSLSYRYVSTDPGCEGGNQNLGLNGYIYNSPPNGIPTQALYRCSTPSDNWVSTDPACEGQNTQFLIGYAQTQP
jgi:hypothetical protein